MYFRVHILPALGDRRAREITLSDIAKLPRKIGARTPVTANDVPAALLTALDEQRFCPAHPKACRRLHRDDGVVAAPALNHMPARPSARGHQRDDGSFGLRLRRSSERGDYVSVNEIIALEEQRRSLAEA